MALSNDHKTTVLGGLVGVIQAVNVDWNQVVHGNSAAICQLIGAVAIGLFAYFTNKK